MACTVDFHAGWVSSALLQRLEPLPQSIDGGQIVRDATGRATGVFLDAALDYVGQLHSFVLLH